MPTFSSNGVNIHYEVAGQGFPLVWSHEFAGDITSWEPQVNFFSRRYQVITYCARGYPPSDVPEEPEAYSQDHSVDDLYLLLKHLGIEQAYVGGLSMGGSVTLSFGIAHPEMCRALIVAGAGAGSTDRDEQLASWEAAAETMLNEGMEKIVQGYAIAPARIQLRRKDPLGWAKFSAALLAHSALGSALTVRGVQIKRATVYQLEDQMRQIDIPTMVLIGDEDEPCIEPSIFMKRNIPDSGLAGFPTSGHTINLEEPDLFNRTVLDFLTAVEAGAWPGRSE